MKSHDDDIACGFQLFSGSAQKNNSITAPTNSLGQSTYINSRIIKL